LPPGAVRHLRNLRTFTLAHQTKNQRNANLEGS
jgi:hypothetical protein